MYNETKIAIKVAFKIGKILFSMSPSDYQKLLESTNNVIEPTPEDLEIHIKAGIKYGEAFRQELQNRYVKAANDSGLEDKYGIAIMKYVAMIREINDD